MSQGRGTDALVSSIDWLKRAVQELGERNHVLENEIVEERVRSQQLARDCQSDLRRMREELEKAEARAARLESEVVERSQQTIQLKAELEVAFQKAQQLREQASGLLRAEREQAQARETAIRELERRNRELREKLIHVQGG